MSNEKKVIAIIDGDGLAYHSLRETIDVSLEALSDKFTNLLSKTNATHYYLFISKGRYFRHEIMPEYKLRKPGGTAPTYLQTLKAVLQDHYKASFLPYVEADDLCAYFYHNFSTKEFFGDKEEGEIILCSPDKDLLKGVPSERSHPGHFNYSYLLLGAHQLLNTVEEADIELVNGEKLVKGHWVNTSLQEAEHFFWSSMIIGDSADAIPGIFRKGKKYAEKLLTDIPPADWREEVFRAYVHVYGEADGIVEFSRNYRALRLLATADDFIREVGHHYEPSERLACLQETALQEVLPSTAPKDSSSFLNDDNI